jgi:hypothetical protein
MWPERRERYPARGSKGRKYGQKGMCCETEKELQSKREFYCDKRLEQKGELERNRGKSNRLQHLQMCFLNFFHIDKIIGFYIKVFQKDSRYRRAMIGHCMDREIIFPSDSLNIRGTR